MSNLEKQLNEILKKEIIEKFERITDDKLKELFLGFLEEQYESSHYRDRSVFSRIESMIISKFTDKFIEENYSKLAAMIDMETLANLVTIKVSKGVAKNIEDID